MITERLRRAAAALLLTLSVATAAGDGASELSVAYLFRPDDPFYAPQRAYTGLSLRNRHRPVDGVRLAVKESRILGRAVGLELKLIESALAPGRRASDAIRDLIREVGVRVFLLDLPRAELNESGTALAGQDLLLFNIRHQEDELRGEACLPNLFHTIPSYSMLVDALAQFLSKKNWKDVLMLEGREQGDRALSRAFQRSAHKFGLELQDNRPFVLGNDPRERGQNNIPILTRGGSYDVVFLADSIGEFGRYVPYNTQQARPVVGSDGLSPTAWHWTYERHGAPQLNQRFQRLAGRHMADLDFAAWAAVKSVVEAAVRAETSVVDRIGDFMRSAKFTLDTYKGAPASYRRWDNQLRQPILLHTHNAVIAVAPIEGFLHQTNHLDTLGTDHRESACAMHE